MVCGGMVCEGMVVCDGWCVMDGVRDGVWRDGV